MKEGEPRTSPPGSASPTLVRQRLKLACVSPKFMQIYRDGQMSFDQLMAFRETKVYQYRAIVQGN